MNSLVRSLILCLTLVLLTSGAAVAADAPDVAGEQPPDVAQHEVSMTQATGADDNVAADPLATLPVLPEWTSDTTSASFGGGRCQGPPVLSCQCGPSLQFPRAEPCCHCNDTCWNGYVLALCGGLGSGE